MFLHVIILFLQIKVLKNYIRTENFVLMSANISYDVRPSERLLCIVGIILLVKGSDALVDRAVKAAEYKIVRIDSKKYNPFKLSVKTNGLNRNTTKCCRKSLLIFNNFFPLRYQRINLFAHTC